MWTIDISDIISTNFDIVWIKNLDIVSERISHENKIIYKNYMANYFVRVICYLWKELITITHFCCLVLDNVWMILYQRIWILYQNDIAWIICMDASRDYVNFWYYMNYIQNLD